MGRQYRMHKEPVMSHRFFTHSLKGYNTPGPLFLKILCIFSKKKKKKQLWTKYPMDLARNVQRNSKITVEIIVVKFQ